MDNVKCAIVIRECDGVKLIVPLQDHLHTHPVMNQDPPHYHSDGRYTGAQPHLSDFIDCDYVVQHYPTRLKNKEIFEIRNFDLIPHSDNIGGVINNLTQLELESLKCDHLVNNKCPHRGYDMSEVQADSNGVRVCPLHGLKFNQSGKTIVKQNE